MLDYAPLPSSPSHASFESDISGIPNDKLEEEWPARHLFTWYGIRGFQTVSVFLSWVVGSRCGTAFVAAGNDHRRLEGAPGVLTAPHSANFLRRHGVTCRVAGVPVNAMIRLEATEEVVCMLSVRNTVWESRRGAHSMGGVASLYLHCSGQMGKGAVTFPSRR